MNSTPKRGQENAPLTGFQRTSSFCTYPYRSIHQKLAASLARQYLPRCHPEIFAGDVTLFHPWRAHSNASLETEINYLRSYTKGDAQKIVNNYRQRQYTDPVIALLDVWTELERQFGNTTAITNVLLERLRKTARFGEGDSDKLQSFADVCTDVDRQLDFLPGLGCLN